MRNFQKIKILSDGLIFSLFATSNLTNLKNIELNLLSFALYIDKIMPHYNKIVKIWLYFFSKIYLT